LAFNPVLFYPAHFGYAAINYSYAFYKYLAGNKRTLTDEYLKKWSASTLNKIPSYKYSVSDNKWIACTGEETSLHTPKQIKIVTFNVLFAPIIDWIVMSNDRFKYQLEVLLPEMNADIICLNEVSTPYLNLLLQQKWIQQGYYISSIDSAYYSKMYRANIILSKFPFQELFLESLDRGTFLGIFAIGHYEFAVASAHFTAYEERFKEREIQITHISQLIQETKAKNMSVIMLGDFNLHSPFENASIKLPYKDVWSELNPDDPGISWDSQTNKLIQYMLPADRRRMRLDRVALKSFDDAPYNINPLSIQLCCNKPIFPTDSNYSYIYPSDHFGLLTEFKFVDKSSKL